MKRYNRKGYTKKPSNPQAKKFVKTVVSKELVKRGLRAPELKHYTEDNSGTIGDSLTWANMSNCLNTVQQGDQVSQRDGNRIQPMKLVIRGRLLYNGEASLVRLLVIRWDSDVPPQATDIFDSPTTKTIAMLSHYNIEKRRYFTVLKDVTFPVLDEDYQVEGYRHINWSFNLSKHKPCIYDANGGNENDFTQGQYYLIYFSDKSPTNGVALQYVTRFSYTDN